MSARKASLALMKEPERCLDQGRLSIDMILTRWWQDERDAREMVSYLAQRARVTGQGSEEHRQVVRLAVACARTVTHVIPEPEDRSEVDAVLTSVEAWAQGGQASQADLEALSQRAWDQWRRIIAYDIDAASAAYSAADATDATDTDDNGNVAETAADAVAHTTEHPCGSPEWKEAKARHLALLADLIRREMPESWKP